MNRLIFPCLHFLWNWHICKLVWSFSENIDLILFVVRFIIKDLFTIAGSIAHQHLQTSAQKRRCHAICTQNMPRTTRKISQKQSPFWHTSSTMQFSEINSRSVHLSDPCSRYSEHSGKQSKCSIPCMDQFSHTLILFSNKFIYFFLG